MSVESLECDRWGPPPAEASYLVRTVHRLRAAPLDALSVEDLRIMIGQGVGVAHLMPIALRVLEAEPLVEGDLYPGDLLVSVLLADHAYWAAHRTEYEVLARIVAELPVAADPPVGRAVTLFRAAFA